MRLDKSENNLLFTLRYFHSPFTNFTKTVYNL